jgi:hypothetical protein
LPVGQDLSYGNQNHQQNWWITLDLLHFFSKMGGRIGGGRVYDFEGTHIHFKSHLIEAAKKTRVQAVLFVDPHLHI